MTLGAETILLVEDNDDDAFFFRRAAKAAGVGNHVFHVEDGGEAVAYLSGKGEFADRSRYPLPGVIFLDLKLPIMSGLEVLAWIRSKPEYKDTIVVVLTSSNEPTDFTEAQRLGANSYKVKPLSATALAALAATFQRVA